MSHVQTKISSWSGCVRTEFTVEYTTTEGFEIDVESGLEVRVRELDRKTRGIKT